MNTRKSMRAPRKLRIRARVSGTAARPRMNVFKSNTSLYVQLIDDESSKTILSLRENGDTVAHAKKLGAEVATAAKKKGIAALVFDRGGFRYHGVIKALADATREGGITI